MELEDFIERGAEAVEISLADLKGRKRGASIVEGREVLAWLGRISLCGVPEYASAEILAFLDLAEKSLVSASRTALSPPDFPDGNGLG
jgi:hypothetical protein